MDFTGDGFGGGMIIRADTTDIFAFGMWAPVSTGSFRFANNVYFNNTAKFGGQRRASVVLACRLLFECVVCCY
jgi:hypothetical protein